MQEDKKLEEVKIKNYFEILNDISVADKIETKGDNKLKYLSWAFAWGEVKKLHPEANYKVYETEQGCIYWTDGKTCWVKTGVTINNIEHIEYLPVMDYKNQSITLEKITSFDVNKAIQRSLTKAIGRHGLGLYIYAGEDLPEEEKKEKANKEDTIIARAKASKNIEGLKKTLEMPKLTPAQKEAITKRINELETIN